MLKTLLAFICALPFLPLMARFASAQDQLPAETDVRHQVNDLIAAAPNHRATLGRLQQAMALSISFGAPAWNAGDHAACCRFYVTTGKDLCAAFAGPDNATVLARHVLDGLKTALARVQTSNDDDANAWTMRFVFDKTDIYASGLVERNQRFVDLGQQCFARSQVDDAATAFADATVDLHELEGLAPADLPVECRYAPLALSDALFARRQYSKAAAYAEEGLHFLPEWVQSTADLRHHFADRATYDLLIADLRDSASSHPDDAGLQFLLGYHLYFTGQKDAAKEYFQRALKINPDDAGARALLSSYGSNPPPPTTPALPPPPKVNGDL